MVRPYYNYERRERPPPRRSSINGGMTTVVRYILIVNVIVFLFELFMSPEFYSLFSRLFGLTELAMSRGMIWQLFTYMFLHSRGLLLHILANMMLLFFLGPEVERGMGSRHFLIMYVVSGILGGFGWLLLNAGGVCIGASGAMMGVLASFAALYPNKRLAFIFLPMYSFKAWVVVLFFGGLELFLYLLKPGSTIAHTVHLAGGVAGCFYTLAVFRPQLLHTKRIADKLRGKKKGGGSFGSGSADSMTPQELDRILDKISKGGMSSLTKRERDLLERASKRRKQRR